MAIVKEGHTVTVAANSATAAGLTINEGGKVVVKAGTAGHSVASVSGDGDLIYELSANAGNTWLTSGNFLGGGAAFKGGAAQQKHTKGGK